MATEKDRQDDHSKRNFQEEEEKFTELSKKRRCGFYLLKCVNKLQGGENNKGKSEFGQISYAYKLVMNKCRLKTGRNF